MQIACVICSDLLVALDDVFGTHCGHLFHYQCLIQWLERSKSCPQCRAKTTEKSIHRVYFNVPSNPETNEDPSVLQNRIDGLNFQLRLKDMDVKNIKENNDTLTKQSSGLREEIKNLDNKIRSHELNISALKEQAQCLRKHNQASDKAIIECSELKKQVQFLRSVEQVVKGTTGEVEEILENYNDCSQSTKALATYVSVLKREIHSSVEKRRDLNKTLRDCQYSLDMCTGEVTDLKEQLNHYITLNQQLEQDLKHGEDEKRSLKRKIKALEQAIMSPSASNPSDKALRRLVAESPAPESLKRLKVVEPILEQECAPAKVKTTCDSLTPAPVSEVESVSPPYLNVKHSSIGLTPLKHSQTSNMAANYKCSIFKRSRARAFANLPTSTKHVPNETYDGLGGHSKLDEFPTPSPKIKRTTKPGKCSVFKIKCKGVTSNTLQMNYFVNLKK